MQAMFTVRVFEVAKTGPGLPTTEPPAPREVKGFQVEGRDADEAKRSAKRAFDEQKREVRSLNVSADRPDTLLAYVFSKPAIPGAKAGA
jgi:hypothetical protein